MKCENCLFFEKAYYYRVDDMPHTPYGFCAKGSNHIERATLRCETDDCIWSPPRFQQNPPRKEQAS